MPPKSQKILIGILLCLLLVGPSLLAQMPSGTSTEGEPSGKPRFAFVPIPNYNESFGFGLGAIASLYYPISKADIKSPPSSTTLFGF